MNSQIKHFIKNSDYVTVTNMNNNIFEIHLYSWKTIQEKI